MKINKTVKLNVKELDSIGDFKALLYDKQDMMVSHQQLFS